MLSDRRMRAGERGQILVMFAFSMLFLILGMIAVAVDLSQLYEARVRAQDAAEQAATAGASQVNYVAAESGDASLLSSFVSVCKGAGDAFSGVAGSTTCTSPEGTDEVVATVTIQASVAMPLPILGGGVHDHHDLHLRARGGRAHPGGIDSARRGRIQPVWRAGRSSTPSPGFQPARRTSLWWSASTKSSCSGFMSTV
jgi:hypothetical protein